MNILVSAIVIFIIVTVAWRLASGRHSIPCPVWLSWLVELDNPFTKTNRAAVIIGHLGLEPGMTVLDAGCGPGRITLPLAKKVGAAGKVIALDVQAGMLARARKKARASGLSNIEFLHAALGDGKLGRDIFDRALLVTVLGEIPERERAIRQMYACLKPGGVLSVTEIIFDPHFQRRSTVRQLARDAGFQEQAVFGNRIAYTLNFTKPVAG